MPRLKLSASLLVLVPEEEREAARTGRPISLRADHWPAIAEELRERFPDLAQRVLGDAGEIRGGFVLVVNDEVMPRGNRSFELSEDDEVCLLVAIAGGSG